MKRPTPTLGRSKDGRHGADAPGSHGRRRQGRSDDERPQERPAGRAEDPARAANAHRFVRCPIPNGWLSIPSWTRPSSATSCPSSKRGERAGSSNTRSTRLLTDEPLWGARMEDGGWRMEDGGWRMEDGGWRMEDGGWRMEDGGWRMEDGGWRMEDRGSCFSSLAPVLRREGRGEGRGAGHHG